MSGQIWSSASLGGFLYSDELSKYIRMALQPMSRFRQFCDIKEGKGVNKGEFFHWNVTSNVAQEGGELDETQTMPETNFTVSQGTLKITEFGNSVPYTKKLDDLSEQDVKDIINKQLKNDARKVLDRAAYTQFAASVVSISPTLGTSTDSITVEVGGATITNNTPLTIDHVKAIADEMKERDITPFTNDDYFSIARPTTLRPFKNELETIHQYTETGAQLIFNGETGRYEGIRFVEQTNIASLNWINAESDQAFFFGADTVMEAIVEPEQIRGKIPTDYGRDRGIAWYYVGGFGIAHNEVDGEQNRILIWDSAA